MQKDAGPRYAEDADALTPSEKLAALDMSRCLPPLTLQDLVHGGLGEPQPRRYLALGHPLVLRQTDHLGGVLVGGPEARPPPEYLPAGLRRRDPASHPLPQEVVLELRQG